MRRRNHSTNEPPPDGMDERRQQYRRHDDIETREIVDNAVDQAPLVSQLLRTAKVSSAVALLFTLVGGVTGAIATSWTDHADKIAFQRSVAAQQDSTRRLVQQDRERIDSLWDAITEIKFEIHESRQIQCIQLRRTAPDLRPDGCT